MNNQEHRQGRDEWQQRGRYSPQFSGSSRDREEEWQGQLAERGLFSPGALAGKLEG